MSRKEFDRRVARIRTIKRELDAWYQRVSSPRIREIGASVIRKRLEEAVKPLVLETSLKH